MADTIDEQLQGLLEQIQNADPALRIPFIVTLTKGARAQDVLPCPIDHDFPVISAVSCKMTAQQALQLAAHASVERIEHDGEVRALETILGPRR